MLPAIGSIGAGCYTTTRIDALGSGLYLCRWRRRIPQKSCGKLSRWQYPTVILASASWACDYLLEKGGSGYLPLRLIEPHIDTGRFHRVAGAPEFERSVYLVMNDDAAANWPFLADILTLARAV